MDITDIAVDDRVEVYTQRTGSYWGYVASIDGDRITLDDVWEGKPATVTADQIERVVFHGRRPEGHVGTWRGIRR